MSEYTLPEPEQLFNALRPRLFSIAYRMLGIRADAEDVVQDAWLRWHASPKDGIASLEAWLVTVTTRLAIDRLRTTKIDREAYVGWWLPEPIVELDENTPERILELANDVSVAFMWVLERLSTQERAAFLMRQVFDSDYAEIADVVKKSEPACRQLVHRALARVQQERPRFNVPKDQHRDLLAKFMQAANQGKLADMRALMSDDVQLVADGGGKVSSFMRILTGAGRVAGVFWSLEHKHPAQVVYKAATVNGEPGLLRYVNGALESVQSFIVDDGRIVAVFIMRNPEKLASIPQTLPA
ncbi:RNA polymerase sigma-70 factor [Massilia yuzhufengensis]|uniref:RNA polymerase sigma-70 factor, ECF subfamily n=1 Tax=Massilia yuzhufengensis TaxID=1164594 RepID=A0A1I1EJK9_9BURK|nr:RNA polymerase sigma-70 factor [Massilia yuzhufengensis]SFB87294.1 RNA polymerase sigma-70 factor, ECF subfamily [Massilia yuzhufengensis]